MERRSERIFGQRYGCRPVRISELNHHLMCVLCSGYYIDATTIIECLHSFCRSCIVRYLETSSRCPICDVLVHKAQPLLNIRVDHVLQGLVYKLVPGLLTKEMNSRREFYSQGLASRRRDENHEGRSTKTQSASIGEESQQRYTQTPSLSPTDSESLSISLEYLPSSKVTESRVQDAESRVNDSATDLTDQSSNEYADIRYLLCPAGFTVGGLKKFIRAKFDLPLVYQIDIFHGDECLENHFSMLDVAFIFQWQKKAPLHLRYSVSYVPRTKRKLTTTNSTRRQNSKENETHPSGSNKNGEENGTTSSQQELTISHPAFCPSKTSKHVNSRTRPVDDDKKSTLCKDNVLSGAKRVGRGGVIRDGKSAVSSRGSGSGHQDAEEGLQPGSSFVEKPTENPRTSTTKDDRVLSGLTTRGNTVSKGGAGKTRERSDVRIITEFQDTRCDRGSQTRKESGQLQTTIVKEPHENIVYDTSSENAELTIDLTGDDLSYSVATQVGETRSGGEIPSGGEISSGGEIPSGFNTLESVNRVVGSVTFVGNGSSAVLSNHHKSVLCNVNSGDITKPTIALPCINAFKTLSRGLHNHDIIYPSSNANDIVGNSVATDDVVKIMSTPEVAIVPSFGIQLIYSPDPISASHNPPICGMIQLPEALTSDTRTRAPTWGPSDVATNGIMNDADFQRLCEGQSIHAAAEKSFGGCFEHFVMPNLVEGVSGGMNMPSDEMSLGYTVAALDSPASGPLPCVFLAAQGAGLHHQPQNSSWGLLPESTSKVDDDAETVDWGVCYPVAAAELGAASSLTSISDGKRLDEQPGCSFICVAASNTLPGSTTTVVRPTELWSQGLYAAERNGTVETPQPVLGSTWPVESRQCEPRAVKMCIVEPQAVKRKAENYDWAVEPKEARISCTESIAVNTEQGALEIRTVGNIIVAEPQAVGTQIMGVIGAVESMAELWAVEPRTMEPVPVEPKAMGSRSVERKSMKTVTMGLRAVEVKTTSSHVVESSPVETLILETESRQTMIAKLNVLEEPNAVRSATVVLQAGGSQTVAAWVAEESLVEPDDVAPPMATARPSTLEQNLVEPDDVEPDDIEQVAAARTFITEESLVEQDDLEPVTAARIFTLGQNLVDPDDVEQDDVEPDEIEPNDVEPDDVEPDEVEPDDVEPDDVEPNDVEPDDLEPVAAARLDDVEPDEVEPVAAARPSTLKQSLVEPDVAPVAAAAVRTFLLEHLESAERRDTGAATEVQSHDEDVTNTVRLDLLTSSNNNLTVDSEQTAGVDHQEETSILQQNLDHSFLKIVSEDSGCQRETARIGTEDNGTEETHAFHQKQRTVIAVDSADNVVENSIQSARQIPELMAKEKCLFFGDDLTKYDETSTDWGCSKEDTLSLSASAVKKDLDFESTAVPKAAVDDATVVLVKMEDTPVSEYLDDSLSLEIEAVRLLAKPENISCKVEDELVSLEEEQQRLAVVDVVKQNPVSAKVEDPDDVDIVVNVRVATDTQSTSYSHQSKIMVLLPSSETMFCSPETTEPSTCVDDIPVPSTYVNHCPVSAVVEDIPVSSTYVNHCPVSGVVEDIPVSSTSVYHCPVSGVVEDIPVSSTSVYHCPVSPVETGVLVADNGMLVSVMDDHVLVCIRDEEPVSVAEEEDTSDEVALTESATEMPVSDDDGGGVPVLESSTEIPGSERTLVSDACYVIPVSDDCSKMTASDDCSKITVPDDCCKMTTSDAFSKITASDDCIKMTTSDAFSKITASDDCIKMTTSDACFKITVSDDCSKMTAPDDCSKMTTSDACSKITVSDDCSKMTTSDACSKITVSDDCSKMTASDDCSKMTAPDDCSKMTTSDACSKITVSDDCCKMTTSDACSKITTSDDYSKIIASDDCSEAPISDSCNNGLVTDVCDSIILDLPVSEVTDLTVVSDADEKDPYVSTDILMLFDDTHVHNNSREGLIPCINNDLAFSVVPDEIPVSDIPEEMPVSDLPEEIPVSCVPENIPVSDVPEEIPVSDVPEEIPVSDVPEEVPVSDVPEEIPVSDVPEEIPVSDVPEEVPVSDVPEEIPVFDVPKELPVSDVLENIPVSNVPQEIPVSDVPENIPVSDVPDNIPVPDVHDEILVSDVHDEILVSDVHEELPVSDVPEEVPVSDVPEEIPISDVPKDIPVSDVHEEIPVSDVHEELPVFGVPEEIPVSDVPEEIPVSDVPEEIPVSDVPEEIPVSDVPEELPVSDVTDESELANSSSGELPISVPIPSIPTKHSVPTEDVPVSTHSLETIPVCSTSLETTPFHTSMPVESIVYPLAISSPAGCCSDLVAQDVAIENQIMSTSDELDEDDLSLFISTSDSEVSEVVPVSEENPAVGDINSEVSEVVPVSEKNPLLRDINSEVSEVVPVSEEYSAVGVINSEVSEVVPVSEENPLLRDINSEVSEVVPVSEEYSAVGVINSEVSEVVLVSEEYSAVTYINSEVSEVVPVSEEYSAVGDINLEVSEVVPVSEEYPALRDINSEVSEVVPVSEVYSAVTDIDSEVSEVVPVSEEYSALGGINSEVSEVVPVSEEYSAVGDIYSEVPELVPLSEENPAVGDINSEVPELVPLSEENPAVGDIYSEVSELVPVSEQNPAVGDINSEVSELVPVSEESPAVGDINSEVSEVVPVSEKNPAVGVINSEVSEVVPVSEENPAVGDINLRAVMVIASAKDGGIEERSSERLDCTEEGEMVNIAEESLVKDDDVLHSSSFSLDFDDGGGSDRNAGLHDMEDLAPDQVPGREAKVIGTLVVNDNDQSSVENRVDLLPGLDSVVTCVEERGKYVDREEDGIALSQRLLCSGSFVPEDENEDGDKGKDGVELSQRLLCSGSFGPEDENEDGDKGEDSIALSQRLLCSGSIIRDDENGDADKEDDDLALSQKLLCSGSFIPEDEVGDKEEDDLTLSQRPLCSGSFIPEDEVGDKEEDDLTLSQRPLCSGSFIDEDEHHDSFQSTTRISRSFSFTSTPLGGNLDSAVPSVSQRRRSRSLNESTKQELQSIDCVSLTEKTASLNRSNDTVELLGVACGNARSVPDEPIVLSRCESLVGDVPVSSLRTQPFVATKMQDDTNAVIVSPVNDAVSVDDETCKFVGTDTIDFCDASGDNLKSSECVLERGTGEMKLGDKRETGECYNLSRAPDSGFDN